MQVGNSTLRRQSSQRLVGASWERSDKGKRAKFYRLTSPGRKQLVVERSRWEMFARAMGLILNPVDQEGR
jgi:PadR family transcriptional regulator, regulatory protein PadR